MSRRSPAGRHLAEVLATYGPDPDRAPHGKISISLPEDLIEQVRSAAAAGGTGVSAVVAAAIRGAIAASTHPEPDGGAGSIRRPLRPFSEIRDRSWSPVGWPISSAQLLHDERSSR